MCGSGLMAERSLDETLRICGLRSWQNGRLPTDASSISSSSRPRIPRSPATPATNSALRISAGSEAVEEGPVGFAGVEERADAVVREAAESEGGAFDSFYEVVDRYLEGLAPWWSRAGGSCRRHVADGVGNAVMAPVTEVLGEVFSELVVVGLEPGDLVEGSLEPLSQRFG